MVARDQTVGALWQKQLGLWRHEDHLLHERARCVVSDAPINFESWDTFALERYEMCQTCLGDDRFIMLVAPESMRPAHLLDIIEQRVVQAATALAAGRELSWPQMRELYEASCVTTNPMYAVLPKAEAVAGTARTLYGQTTGAGGIEALVMATALLYVFMRWPAEPSLTCEAGVVTLASRSGHTYGAQMVGPVIKTLVDLAIDGYDAPAQWPVVIENMQDMNSVVATRVANQLLAEARISQIGLGSKLDAKLVVCGLHRLGRQSSALAKTILGGWIDNPRDQVIVAVPEPVAYLIGGDVGAVGEYIVLSSIPSPEQLSVAEHLWDPDGVGPLSDLQAAVEAGLLLEHSGK